MYLQGVSYMTEWAELIKTPLINQLYLAFLGIGKTSNKYRAILGY